MGKDDDEVQSLPLAPAQKGGHLRAFLTDIAGEAPHNELDTTAVLSSARQVIRIQQAADSDERETAFR